MGVVPVLEGRPAAGRNEFHFHLVGLKVSVKGPSGQAIRQGP